MKRILIHLLLACVLILQGVTTASGATLGLHAHACCPDGITHSGQSAAQGSHCPCCPDQTCASDCVLLCASSATAFIPPLATLAQLEPASVAPLPVSNDALRVRGVAPPTRPPIA